MGVYFKVEFAEVSGFCLYDVTSCLQVSNFIRGFSRSVMNLRYLKDYEILDILCLKHLTLVWVLKGLQNLQVFDCLKQLYVSIFSLYW